MTDLATRLSDEADQCRNDGADDIARLLDEAAAALRQPGPALVAAARPAIEALRVFVDFPADTFSGDHDGPFTMTVQLRDLRAARATIAALSNALAEQAAEQAPHPSYPHITQPYTLDEIRAQIASHDYSAELLLQHAMLLLDDAEQAEPVCQCGDRPKSQCPEPWEIGCDLGNNEKYVRVAAPPAPARQEPLFLLHTGQIDSEGEQDEWDIEANSWVSVEEFCLAHPGQTIGLHPQPLPAAPITAAPAEGGAA